MIQNSVKNNAPMPGNKVKKPYVKAEAQAFNVADDTIRTSGGADGYGVKWNDNWDVGNDWGGKL